MTWKKVLHLTLAILLVVTILGSADLAAPARAASINIRVDTGYIQEKLNSLRSLLDQLQALRVRDRTLEQEKEAAGGSQYSDEYILYLLDLYGTDPDNPEVQEHKDYILFYQSYRTRKNEISQGISSVLQNIKSILDDLRSMLDWPYISDDFNDEKVDEIEEIILQLQEAIQLGDPNATDLLDTLDATVGAAVTGGENVCGNLTGKVAVTLHANRDDAYFNCLDYYINSPNYQYTETGTTSEGIVVLMDPDKSIEIFDPYSHFICLSDGYGPFSGDTFVYVFAGWADSPLAQDPDLWMSDNTPVVKSRELYAVWKKDMWKTTAELEYDSVPYDGTPKCPSVTVTMGDYVLQEGTDYDLEYSNNVGYADSQGRGTVKITGKGEWWQSRSLYFTIEPTGTPAAPPVIEVQPEEQKVAAGQTARFSAVAANADSCRWQYSTDGTTWKDCKSGGSDSSMFTFTATTSMNSRLYRCRFTNGAGSSYTDAVRLTVVGFKTHPADQTAAAGSQVTFKVTAVGAESYQWQYSTNGTTWKNCSSTGYNKASFTFKATAAMNGRLYRCQIRNGDFTVSSDPAVLTVKQKPVITIQPGSLITGVGAKAGFKVSADYAETYRWQVSKDGGKTWKNCTSTGCDQSAFTFTVKASYNGWQYRCVIGNEIGSVTSQAATLTVDPALNPPVITEQPKSQTIPSGSKALFTVTATGEDLTYRWQVNKSGTWNDCSSAGCDTATFSFNVKTIYAGWKYRCVVSNKYGSVISDVATLSVISSLNPPTITVQPKAQSVKAGAKASFTVTAAGTGVTYQWQVSKDGGKTWKNCTSTGYDTATLSFTAKASYSGWKYRCVVGNPYGSVTTNAVSLTVS